MTIEGINVLNVTEKVSAQNITIGLLMILLAVVCFSYGIWIIPQGLRGDFCGFSIFMIVIGVLEFSVGILDLYNGIMHLRDKQTFIQATVDERASWKQIDEQYELVGKDGQIYTFILKDAEQE